MRIHTKINPHPNNMDFGNLYEPYGSQPKDSVLSSKRPLSEIRLKRKVMTFSFIFLWISFLPVRAIADQCIEGDCVNGKGTMIYSTGHKYVGEFEEGKRQGQGRIYMPGGRTFEGQFRQNAPIKGTYTHPNGQVYTGTWEFYERNGQGTLKYPDGRIYEGEFKSGLRNGKGVMTWPDGRQYEGEFVRGKRTGKGIMTYPDGRVYTGYFKTGERSGQEAMTNLNGEQMEKQFFNGEYFGPR